MKKGVSIAQILLLIKDGINLGFKVNTDELKEFVIKGYNEIYSVTSKDTIIANLREEAIVNFQEGMFITKLPQDNNKLDLLAAKIENDRVKIVFSQQKGNNLSFNSTSLNKTLDILTNLKLNKNYEKYFNLLPNELNPNLNGLECDVDIIIGFTLAVGYKLYKLNGVEIMSYSGDEYLKYLGINNKTIFDIDFWVINHPKIVNHTYNAIEHCEDFNEVFSKCLTYYS